MSDKVEKQIKSLADRFNEQFANLAMGFSFNAPNLYAQTGLPGSEAAKAIVDAASAGKKDYPVLSAANTILGALANPLARKNLVSSGATAAKQVVGALGSAAIQGGVANANSDQYQGSVGDIASSYGKNAVLGAAEGAAGAGALMGGAKAAQVALNKFSPQAVKAFTYLQDKYGASVPKDQAAYNPIQNPNTPKIVDEITRGKPELRQQANDAANNVINSANPAVERTLAQGVANPTDYVTKVTQDIPAQKVAANQAYEAAKQTSVPYDDSLRTVLNPDNANVLKIFDEAKKLAAGRNDTSAGQKMLNEVAQLETAVKGGTPPKEISVDTLQALKGLSNDLYEDAKGTGDRGVKTDNSHSIELLKLKNNFTDWVGNLAPEIKQAWAKTEKFKAEESVLQDAREVYFKGDSHVGDSFIKDMSKKYDDVRLPDGKPVLSPEEITDLSRKAVAQQIQTSLVDPTRGTPGATAAELLDKLTQRESSFKDLLGDNYHYIVGDLAKTAALVKGAQDVAKKTNTVVPGEEVNPTHATTSLALGLYHTAANAATKLVGKLSEKFGTSDSARQGIVEAVTTPGGLAKAEAASNAAQNPISRGATAIDQGFDNGAIQSGAVQGAVAGTTAANTPVPTQEEASTRMMDPSGRYTLHGDPIEETTAPTRMMDPTGRYSLHR